MSPYSQVKPVWASEIGTRTAEQFDGTEWKSLPSMSRAKVKMMDSSTFQTMRVLFPMCFKPY